MFNSQGHIATDSVQVEELVHTSWSRFCTVNHQAPASNYQLSNMKRPGLYSNRWPQRLKASTLTATPPSPLIPYVRKVFLAYMYYVADLDGRSSDIMGILQYINQTMPVSEADLKCPVCLGPYEEEEKIREMPCRHNFHTKCLLPWLQKVRTYLL